MAYFGSFLVTSWYHESPLCVQLFPWLVKFPAHKNPTDWSLPVFVSGNIWSGKPVSQVHCFWKRWTWWNIQNVGLSEEKDLTVGECDSSPKLLTVKQTGSVIYRKGGVVLHLKYFAIPPTTPLWEAYHLTAPSRTDAYIIIKKKNIVRKQETEFLPDIFLRKGRKRLKQGSTLGGYYNCSIS